MGSTETAARELDTPVWHIDEPVLRPTATATVRCHTAIVGAGLTGLSAALHLAEHGRHGDVVVLDADRVGAGASSRGTGLVGPRIGPRLAVARKRYGDTTATALFEWSQRAVAQVHDLCERYRLECDLVPGTQLVLARDPHAADQLTHDVETARSLGLDVDLVAASDLPTLPGRYLGGTRYPRAATVNPAALTRVLAAAAECRDVRIFDKSPVRRIHLGTPLRLSTDSANIIADHVLMATNGLTSTLVRATGILGMRVQAAATTPLTPEQLDAIGWLRHEPIIESGDIAPYYRLTPDNRLIVGGGAVVRGTDGSTPPNPHFLRGAAALLHPSLAGIRLSHAWTGPIGMTRDALPVIGARRDNILIAGGWCGHGIAAATYAGTQLARRLLETPWGGLDSVFPVTRASGPAVPSLAPIHRAIDLYLARLTQARTRSLGNHLYREFSDAKTAPSAAHMEE